MTARVEPAGYFRFALRFLGLILALIACLPLHFVWRLLRLSSPWPKYFLAAVGWICGARRHSEGVPLRRDVILISNHLSWIDIPILAGANGSAFVAKAELEDVPVIGWLCSLNHTLFVSRTDRMKVAEQINQLRAALAENWAITIFPEGTTSDGRVLLPFKGSLLAVLEPPPPGILVQPVMLEYGPASEEIAWVGDETGQDNAFRLLARKGSFTATVHFLDPFDPRAFADRKDIAAEARARIAAAMSAKLGAPVA